MWMNSNKFVVERTSQAQAIVWAQLMNQSASPETASFACCQKLSAHAVYNMSSSTTSSWQEQVGHLQGHVQFEIGSG